MVYKYVSSNTDLDSAIALLTIAHGMTDGTIFENIIYTLANTKLQVRNKRYLNENIYSIFENIKSFIFQQILYSTSVRSSSYSYMTKGEINGRISSPSYILEETFNTYDKIYRNEKMNVSSKTMKQTFNNVRKSLREYFKDEFESVNNELLETYNKNINLLKISTGEELANVEIKEENQSKDLIGYYNYKARDVMINIDDIEGNKEKIREYIRTGPDKLMKYPFFRLIEENNKDAIEQVAMIFEKILEVPINNRYKIMKKSSKILNRPLQEMYLLSESELKILKNTRHLHKLIKRNLRFLNVMLMDKGSVGFLENKKNEDIWYHHIINEETPDNFLRFRPNPDESPLFDSTYGIQEMLVVRNNKVEESQKGYIKTGEETGPSTQNYDARNQKGCSNGLMISPFRSTNSPLLNFKNNLSKELKKVICESETTQISSIILLCWSLGYEHLTLFSSNCRSNSSTDKGFRAQTDESKTIGNVKNKSLFKDFEEKYNLIRKSVKRKTKGQSKSVKRKKSSSENQFLIQIPEEAYGNSSKSSAKRIRNRVNKSKKCPKGKKLYEPTNRCRKITKKCLQPKKLYKPTNRCRTKKCQSGKKLFKPTNRCRKITKKCPQDKFLFRPTKRCRKKFL